MFHALRPSRAPGFAYAWLELISHRLLMSKLLLNTPQQKVWYWYWNSLLRAGKANPWRRLSLLNKHYNNYWWPNAVALALERIHNPVEVLNQTARYKHYSKTYYLSPPHPHHLPACDKVVDHAPWEYWYFLRFCVGGWLFVTVAHIRRYEIFFVTIFRVA